MNNNDIVEAVAAANSLGKTEARKIIDSVIAVIADAATKGDEISLAGFGKFKITNRPARQGRNPANGETIAIAASKKIGFTPAKALKDKVNG